MQSNLGFELESTITVVFMGYTVWFTSTQVHLSYLYLNDSVVILSDLHKVSNKSSFFTLRSYTAMIPLAPLPISFWTNFQLPINSEDVDLQRSVVLIYIYISLLSLFVCIFVLLLLFVLLFSSKKKDIKKIKGLICPNEEHLPDGIKNTENILISVLTSKEILSI